MVMRKRAVLQRQAAEKRQWIDKGLELEGIDGAGGCGRVRELVDAATEPGARNRSQGGERRLPEQIAAIQHHLGSLDLPSRSIQQDHRPILG